MRVLVTGGAGFIGSAVCRLLVSRYGIPVVNLDKLTYAANPRSLDPITGDRRYIFEQGDVCDRSTLDAIFAKYQPTRRDSPCCGKPCRSIDHGSRSVHRYEFRPEPINSWKRQDIIIRG